MSLLTICQLAANELNIVQPSSVINSVDRNTLQLLAYANKEGKELARRFDWQILMKEATFTTAATETQVTLATIGANFGRYVNESMWNRTSSWKVMGPLQSHEWQRKKAASAQVAVGNWFRIRGGSILFFPVPTAGETIYFEYISKYWCQSNAAVEQQTWAADTDTALIDEEIIRLGIVWRWKKSKGMDYGEDFRTYEMALIDIFGPDAGKAILEMEGAPQENGLNIPEGNWPI